MMGSLAPTLTLLAASPTGYWTRVSIPGEGPLRGWSATGPDEVWIYREHQLHHLASGTWETIDLPPEVAEGCGDFRAYEAPAGTVWWFFCDGRSSCRWFEGEWASFELPMGTGFGGIAFSSPDRGCTSAIWTKLVCFDGTLWAIVDDPVAGEIAEVYVEHLWVAADWILVQTRRGFTYVEQGGHWKKIAPPTGARTPCRGGHWHGSPVMICGETQVFHWVDSAWTYLPEDDLSALGMEVINSDYVPQCREVHAVHPDTRLDLECPYGPGEYRFFDEGRAWILTDDGFLFRRERQRMPQFQPLSEAAGIGAGEHTADVVVRDLNGDGADDLFVASADQADRLYLSLGAAYQERSELLGDEADCCAGTREFATMGDLDGDLLPEVVIERDELGARHSTTSEYKIDRRLRWRALAETGVEGAPALVRVDAGTPPTASTLVDLDGDQDLDIYRPRFFDEDNRGALGTRSLNDGRGRFKAEDFPDDRSGGASQCLSYSATAANLDDAPGEELVVLGFYGRGNRLYRSRDGGLEDATRESGIAAGYGISTQATAGDLDGDADLDLLVLGAEFLRAYRNDGDLAFRDVTRAEYAMSGGGDATHKGAALADLDGDGDLDVVLSRGRAPLVPGGDPRPRILLNDGLLGFEDASVRLLDESWSGFSGVVAFDAGGDGDSDLYFFGSAEDLVVENITPATHWIDVRFRCSGANSGCVGGVLIARQGSRVVLGVPVPRDRSSFDVPIPGGKPVDLELQLPDGRVQELRDVSPGVVWMGDGLGLAGLLSRIPRLAALRLTWSPHGLTWFKLSFVLLLCGVSLMAIRARAPHSLARSIIVLPAIVLVVAGVDVAAAWSAPAIDIGAGPLLAILLLGGLTVGELAVARYRRARYTAHFKLLGFLGEGGMGRVYKARDLANGKIVALKIVKPDVLATGRGRERFLREADLCWSVSHPGVVQVYEKGECEAFYEGEKHETVYLSMEFVPGVTVTQVLGLHAGEVPLERVLIETDCPYLAPQPHRGKRNEPAYLVHVAAALAEIHQMEPAEVSRITAANTTRLFRLE